MSESFSVRQLIDWAAAILVDSDTPRLDAKILFKHVSGYNDLDLILKSDQIQENEICNAYSTIIEQRKLGKPIAYLTGHKEFWSLEFSVNKNTLIPRPETELLVETVLSLIPDHDECQIVDLGTGSGAIAIAIAKERPKSHVLALDSSRSALNIARHNANHHGIKNIEFIEASWFDRFSDECFDFIVSNPPYISPDDPHLVHGDVRFEPEHALVATGNGLDDLIRIISAAPRFLKQNGWLLVEHGFDQAESVKTLFRQNGFHNISCKTDLNHQPRVGLGQQIGNSNH